jgi:hypothetical protein
MNSYIIKLWVVPILIILNACTDSKPSKGRYIIENSTERKVKIKFYERQQLGDQILILTKEIEGPGILYDKVKVLEGVTDREGPRDIFGADSLAVIFDNEKIQPHYEGLPFENSLVFFSDYIQEGDTKRYIITEENYQNAAPCDGDCE